MQSGIEFRLQHHHDRPLDLNPRQALKGFGHDFNGVMRLPARSGARMARMGRAIILNGKRDRLECGDQRCLNSGLPVSWLWHLNPVLPIMPSHVRR